MLSTFWYHETWSSPHAPWRSVSEVQGILRNRVLDRVYLTITSTYLPQLSISCLAPSAVPWLSLDNHTYTAIKLSTSARTHTFCPLTERPLQRYNQLLHPNRSTPILQSWMRKIILHTNSILSFNQTSFFLSHIKSWAQPTCKCYYNQT